LPVIDSAASHPLIADGLARAVREAGSLARSKFRSQLRTWTKGNNSPVSEVDIELDSLLRERLTAIAPYAWLSEESNDDIARLASDRVWIVDPLDGTRAFLAGREDWCVSAALVENGRPIMAAIYVPLADELWIAAKGEGARVNFNPIAAKDGNPLASARVAGPKPYLDQLAALEPGIERIPKVFSLAVRLVRVASGAIDVAFASDGGHDWDLAAADLLLKETGGVLSNFRGELPRYNREDPRHEPLVAAGRNLHHDLLKLASRGFLG
jgi:myo-inositol-1(or 4)-monophosphatase